MSVTKRFLPLVIVTLAVFSATTNTFAAAKKWYPGHYMLAYAGSTTNAFQKIANEPNFMGAMVFHTWTELEPAKGVYNFSAITNELNALQAQKKRFVLQVADKTFASRAGQCVPDYMLKDPQYKGGQFVTYKGGKPKSCVPKRWIPAVQDRLIALYSALGARFDDEPNFVAIQTTENAMSVNIGEAGYTPQVHVEQLKRGLSALTTAFPHTPVFQKVNWKRVEVAPLVAHARSVGAGIGGPDLLPVYPTDAYPYYKENYGDMPLAIDAQSGAKYLKTGEVTFDDLFTFAVTSAKGLRANYVFWANSEKFAWSFEKNVKPVINYFGGYKNTACPSNISCQ